MILDAAFPGLPPWDDILAHPAFWHVRFHQTDLPEKLVAGRQAAYFRYFLSSPTFTEEDVAHYAHAYGDPDRLSAAFEFYRAFPANTAFFRTQGGAIDVPLVLGAGESDAFTPFLPRIAEGVRAQGWTSVTTEIIEDAAHYVMEERPEAAAALIARYAGSGAAPVERRLQ